MSDLKSSVLTLFSDGGARGNPGPAAGGVLIFWRGKEIFRHGEFLGTATNNVAEYSALLMGVRQCLDWKRGHSPFPQESWAEVQELEFCLDSQLVVEQLCGRYRIKDLNMQRLSRKVVEGLSAIGLPRRFTHIPRARNAEADALVNQVLDKNI